VLVLALQAVGTCFGISFIEDIKFANNPAIAQAREKIAN
jgi:hypothetical protein